MDPLSKLLGLLLVLQFGDVQGAICECVGCEVVNGQCLTFNMGGLTWTVAQQKCASVDGGRLAKFDDTIAAHKYITANHSGTWYRIGATDSVIEGNWTWIDGQSFVPNPWDLRGGRHSNDDAADWLMVSQHGYQHMKSDGFPGHGYICEINFTFGGVGASDTTKEDFGEFISKYNLVFENKAEKEKSIKIFSENLKEIQNHNILYDRGNTSYRKVVNQFTHLTYKEFISTYNGYKAFGTARSKRSTSAQARSTAAQARSTAAQAQYTYNSIDPEIDPEKDTPTLDWRDTGFLNPIRNQSHCNSCWAFSATAVIESQIAKEYGVLPQLSEQYLIDCDSAAGGAHGNHTRGCTSGQTFYAIAYVKRHRIALASGYPYTAAEGTCKKSAPLLRSYSVDSLRHINKGSDTDLLNANIHIGPISVAIHVPPGLQLYGSGVYYNKTECTGKKPNHAVLLVGYGTEKVKGKDHKYWLIRNSWGTGYGEKGYYKLSRETLNYCAISSDAVFPVIKSNLML